MTWQVIHADCLEAMAAMDEASVDAIVTDPPYGLEFMGKEWDRFAPQRTTAKVQRSGAGGFGEQKWRSGTKGVRTTFKCRNCGGWSGSFSEARRERQRPCECDTPDLDYAGAPAALLAFQSWSTLWATAALRVLKPGGHLLAFGGTRTYHRLACAVEDAGFEIRDCLAWMYGSGFPKSLDVSKAIDKAAGVTDRPITGEKRGAERLRNQAPDGKRDGRGTWGDEVGRDPFTHGAVTPEAQRWQGWGTALKPAFEPVVLARKPLVGSVASNVQTYGTGALNIDDTRIEAEAGRSTGLNSDGTRSQSGRIGFMARPWMEGEQRIEPDSPAGRWPANVVLDPEAAALLDEQTGEVGGGKRTETVRPRNKGWVNSSPGPGVMALDNYGDTGGASRFFYCPKADREERDRGLEHRRPVRDADRVMDDGPGGDNPRNRSNEPQRNPHPTVKPVELMRWLCRLVTPPGGTVLDPFTGSGSTGIAALREGFNFVGIEREADYVEIARDRIIGDAPLFNHQTEVVTA